MPMEGVSSVQSSLPLGLMTLPSDGPRCLTGGETEAQRGEGTHPRSQKWYTGSGFQPGPDPGLNLVPHQRQVWGILAGPCCEGPKDLTPSPVTPAEGRPMEAPSQCLGILRAFPHQGRLSKMCRALSLQSSKVGGQGWASLRVARLGRGSTLPPNSD